jgi:hypothetical protein
MDSNVLSGTVSLKGTKSVQVAFKNSAGSNISFTKAPQITLTLLNTTAVVFKVGDVKTGNLFTGFTLGFQNSVTCDVSWQVLEQN